MRIAFFEMNDWDKFQFKKVFKGHELRFYDYPLTIKSASKAKDCEIISVFIYSKISKPILDKLKNTKLIVTRSMGFDHIDLESCKKRKILVSNAPHYGDSSVAEHAFALILSLSRNIHKAYERTINNNFSIQGLEGFDIKGKTLGVIGTGRIGSHVVSIALGFNMNVLAFDVYKNQELQKKLNFKYVSLNDLLKSSDIITLHVPYMPSTHHLINQESIKKIKPGCILINTSRGAVVDSKALLYALKSKRLSALGLDVLEGEESLKNDKLKKYDLNYKIIHNKNVLFTPHIAFYSKEAVQNIIDSTILSIHSFLKNKPLNLIN